MRLIDRDELIKSFCHECDGACDFVNCDCVNCEENSSRCAVIQHIKNAPAVDAVPVVRCKDCKHFYSECCLKTGFCVDDDWFCADGVPEEKEK